MWALLMHSEYQQREKPFNFFPNFSTLLLTFNNDHCMLCPFITPCVYNNFTSLTFRRQSRSKNMSISERQSDMKVFCWHFCQLLHIFDSGFTVWCRTVWWNQFSDCSNECFELLTSVLRYWAASLCFGQNSPSFSLCQLFFWWEAAAGALSADDESYFVTVTGDKP